MVLLDIKDLKTYFYTDIGTVKAVNGVNFKIRKGEVAGLVGETGCGKSVTALSIMGLIQKPGKIVGGEIIFEGEDLLKKTEEEMRKIRGNKISMVFQDPMTSLNPVFKVGDQILEAILLHQTKQHSEALEKTIEIVKAVYIPDPEERVLYYPHQFSGGMRQRAMIAMMLSCRPSLFIADEPTSSLDATTQIQILNLMFDFQKKFNMSILLITHNLGLVARTCDKVVVLYAGQVMEEADVKSIFHDPKHPYTKGLLGSIPKPLTSVQDLNIIPGVVPSLINPPPGCLFNPRCSEAHDRCRIEQPHLVTASPDHRVACHLYG